MNDIPSITTFGKKRSFFHDQSVVSRVLTVVFELENPLFSSYQPYFSSQLVKDLVNFILASDVKNSNFQKEKLTLIEKQGENKNPAIVCRICEQPFSSKDKAFLLVLKYLTTKQIKRLSDMA